MIRCYWFHAPNAPLTDAPAVEPVINHIAAFPLATWARYALNGLSSFRPWSVERLQIDALTQRTHALTLEDTAGRWRCQTTLGKFGERPATLLQGTVRALEPADADALEAWLAQTLTTITGVERVNGVNVLALEAATCAPIPDLDAPGAWDWVSPKLLPRSAWPRLTSAPGTATERAGGLLLTVRAPRWSTDSTEALQEAAAWWGALTPQPPR